MADKRVLGISTTLSAVGSGVFIGFIGGIFGGLFVDDVDDVAEGRVARDVAVVRGDGGEDVHPLGRSTGHDVHHRGDNLVDLFKRPNVAQVHKGRHPFAPSFVAQEHFRDTVLDFGAEPVKLAVVGEDLLELAGEFFLRMGSSMASPV